MLSLSLKTEKGKEDTFITNLHDPAFLSDVNLLLNDPLAKQDACNQLGCSFASTCQIRNVSLSSFTNIASTKQNLDFSLSSKKTARLVCECPGKCSLYEHLITELIAEANQRIANLNQDNHYSANQLTSSFDFKPNDEYYLQSSSKCSKKTLVRFIISFLLAICVQYIVYIIHSRIYLRFKSR